MATNITLSTREGLGCTVGLDDGTSPERSEYLRKG